ncbi:MAG: tetratricopeptide repeat protein [Polyangiaceae bacterium]
MAFERRAGRRFLGAIVVAAALGLRAASASAQVDDATRASARQLGEEGNDLFDRGDWASALERYERAAALVNVPTLGVKAARCLDKLGRLVEASERYLAVTRMNLPPDALAVHKDALASAETERDALLPRLPSILIQLQGREAEVFLDGKPVPKVLLGVKRAIDPGTHRVEAHPSQGATVVRVVTVKERETVPVLFVIPKGARTAAGAAPAPTAMPVDSGRDGSTQRVLGFAALGLGGAGLAMGAVVGLVAASDKADLERECGSELSCPPASHDAADAYNIKRSLSTVGFIAGGVAAAAGVALILTAPSGASTTARSPDQRRLGVAIGPTRVTVSGAF